MRIDHHIHLGKDICRWGFEQTTNQLISYFDKYNIEKGVVFACPNLPKKNNPYLLDNLMIKCAANNDSRIVPYLFSHPYLDDLEMIQKLDSQFEGYKLYCNAKNLGYSYSDMINQDQIKFIFSRQKPVVCHIAKEKGERPIDLIKLIEQYDSTPIVLAHMGRLFHDDLCKLSSYDNVYVDLAPLTTLLLKKELFLAESKYIHSTLGDCNIETVVDYLNVLFKDRLVWGSDAPWCNELSDKRIEGELEVLDLLISKNLNNSFL
ncbi:amidohydrolase family protein [Candidatus Woesearchaeota archaeon]|jgi:hypothetical protein|nr:amidohydrolase family protein [Candidatus Woesearchaeota archaeon]MBT7367922.1 amidohydrolase family protein [Candidatus Woesearchaeota archaeon]